MKILKLIGFHKSEFQENEDYSEVFYSNGLSLGRMISGSKSGYMSRNPNNNVVFNANIVTKKSGKVWHGDLDITLDIDKLKSVAVKLNEDLYILREMDARFENESAGFKYWKSKAVEIVECDVKK